MNTNYHLLLLPDWFVRGLCAKVMETHNGDFVGFVILFMVSSLEFHSDRCVAAFICTGIGQGMTYSAVSYFSIKNTNRCQTSLISGWSVYSIQFYLITLYSSHKGRFRIDGLMNRTVVETRFTNVGQYSLTWLYDPKQVYSTIIESDYKNIVIVLQRPSFHW